MNYPIQSLAIIAPMIFLVLIIAMPVVGVFAGWKRAAYWGGGNFVFFLIGVIIWKAAGLSIASKFTSLISGMLPQGTTVTPQLIQSVVAPVFFLVIMFIAEVILVINYYTWFKRVAKIKEDIAANKARRAAKKAGKKMAKKSMPSSAWGKIQFTTKGKIINMVGGGVGLGLLLAPTTITFTQAVYYLTTNTATREKNGFSNGLYNLLQNNEKAFSWISYYNGIAGIDCNSLLSVLGMYTSKVTYKTLNSDGTISTTESQGTGIDAFSNIMSTGISAVMTQSAQATSEEKHGKIVTAVNNFATVWNSMMKVQGTSVTAMLESGNVTNVIQQIFEQQTKGKETTLNKAAIQNAFGEDSEFLSVYQEYIAEGSTMTQVDAVPVTQEAYESMVVAINSAFKFDTDVEDDDKADFEDGISVVMKMLFYPV